VIFFRKKNQNIIRFSIFLSSSRNL